MVSAMVPSFRLLSFPTAFRRLTSALAGACGAVALSVAVGAETVHFAEAPHDYWKRPIGDRFSKVMEATKDQPGAFDTSGEKPALQSLLKALDIPVSSQLLVFSATSLQSALINPRNPRAIYFNDDTFVGFVPGGRMEIASFDAEAGMVFYIFDRLGGASGLPRYARSDRCMNCHAAAGAYRRPGLVMESVAVTWDGSSQETYRYDEIGHQVPYEKRLGGWHVTGDFKRLKTKANIMGRYQAGTVEISPNEPGTHCNLDRYLLPTSDVLVHLVHEHQAGFIDRVIDSVYATREKPGDDTVAERLVTELSRYVLFADEPKLPGGPIQGDPRFIKDFQARGAGSPGAPLREFDLSTRLFRTRCSYMLATPVWQAVPQLIRQRVQQRLAAAVDPAQPSPLGAHLSPAEKERIRGFLKRLPAA